MSKKILALDQSSHCSGYAIFDGSDLVDSGTFTESNNDVGKRLKGIRDTVQKMIKENNIDQVYFEDIQYQQKANIVTYKALAEVMGVIKELLTELKIPYESVPAVTWRSTLGIKGTRRPEQKKNAQAYVLKTYNKNVTEDESDAICIGSHALKQEESAF